MKNLITFLTLLVCLSSLGGSLPLERQLQFFNQPPTNAAPAGWTLLTNITVGSTDSGTSCTTDAIDTTNATLIVIVQSGYSAVNPPIPAPTSNPANTWTRGVSNAAAGFSYSAIYWATNLTTSATHTFTTSRSQTYTAMTVYVFKGGAGVLDQTNSNSGSASTLQTGSVTPSEDNELIIAGIAFQTGSTASINSSFSTPVVTGFNSGQNIGVAGSYLIQGPAGAVNPTYTLGGSSSVCATIMTFRR